MHPPVVTQADGDVQLPPGAGTVLQVLEDVDGLCKRRGQYRLMWKRKSQYSYVECPATCTVAVDVDGPAVHLREGLDLQVIAVDLQVKTRLRFSMAGVEDGRSREMKQERNGKKTG